jgi:hypothetical protein
MPGKGVAETVCSAPPCRALASYYYNSGLVFYNCPRAFRGLLRLAGQASAEGFEKLAKIQGEKR